MLGLGGRHTECHRQQYCRCMMCGVVCVRVPGEISVSLRCTVTMFGKSYPHTHSRSEPTQLTMSTCSRAGFNQSQTTGSKIFNILCQPLWLSLPPLSSVLSYYVNSELKQNYLMSFSTGRTEDR